MNGKLKVFLTQILILLSLVIAINLFAFIAIKFGFLNSEYSMAGCTVIGVGAYLFDFSSKIYIRNSFIFYFLIKIALFYFSKYE